MKSYEVVARDCLPYTDTGNVLSQYKYDAEPRGAWLLSIVYHIFLDIIMHWS